MIQEPTYKAMYKYELARMAGVSVRTLNRWLSMHSQELEKLGYTKHTHLLSPLMVKYICEKFVL